ncbi:glyceraldehyde 3-phosphate dehydrogenase NAD-binding domain-containing protein [Helicobacter sp. 11S02629-2]|uniref:type I glyceraldehyde-3-phosphate dehydrogenase n=1 Tax=Helicobacter sp. 11S02629-2 TaxID=1476195 RepID=UPI000BA78EF4|nr:glyceraldehyde 3-phosphate dehydrogenase NAD-binding domain-containing protein [Helicobacter sp. 11S02629-2]PAF46086.1 type I glyceraldehyde-3-phosphate dehydrogenase [Helicobacter sp. 11S02629-2]
MTVAINGFGRIGRVILREALKRNDIKVVACNDISSWEILSYLLEFDTAHGPLNKEVILEGDRLLVGNQDIKLTSLPNFHISDVDFVLECTGKVGSITDVTYHLDNGVKNVIIGANAKDTPTFVLGANTHLYKGERIISNASCTTNCIASICKIIDSNFTIKSGTLSTVHSYTNDQNLVDSAHRSDKRRSRASAQNIVPTTTNAALALHKVLPNLKGKMHGHSLRVPVLDVSMSDLSFCVEKRASKEEINDLFIKHSQTDLKGILKVDSKHRVSSDFLGDSASSIVALDLTFSIQDMIKVMAWYDNETGYANRMLDMCNFIHNFKG